MPRILTRLPAAGALAALALATACAPLDPWQVDRASATQSFSAGDYATAQAVMEGALARAEADAVDGDGADVRRLATALDELGSIHYRQGNWAEAERLWREALAHLTRVGATTSVEYASSANNLGHLLVETERFPEAEGLHKEALEIRQDRNGYMSAPVAQSLNNLSVLNFRAGQLDIADEYARKAREVAWFARGHQHGYVAAAINNQAAVAEARGDVMGALELYGEALRRSDDPAQRAATLNNIALLELRAGYPRLAVGHLEEAMAYYEAALPEAHPHRRQVAGNLARAYRAVGDPVSADRVASEALIGGLDTLAQR